MKKFLIFVLALAVLVVAGVGLFIATFDANHFKPQIIQAIENAIGSPVGIGNLKLGWSQGIVFQIDKVAVYPNRQSMEKAAATLDHANVYLKLGPLLHKKIEVISITLVRPRLNIIKEANGLTHVNGLKPPSSRPPQTSKVGSQASSGLPMESFLIGIIKIEKGEVGYVDRSAEGVFKKIAVKDLDVIVKNLSFKRPVDFEAKFSLFGGPQNMSLKGRLLIPSAQGPYTLEDFELQNDLGTIKLSELSEAMPSMKNSGLVEPLQGALKADIGRLSVGAKGLGDLNAALTLKAGRFQTQYLRSPLGNVVLQADINKNDLNLKKFSADFAKGTLTAQGVSRNYISAASQTHIGFKADELKLEELLSAPKPGRPQLNGSLSMVFNGDAQGMSWPSISNTLNGSGSVSLKDGVVTNLNLLKTIFDNLAKIPGVSDTLNNQLSPGYREKLAAPTTVLEPLNFNVSIANGQLIFPELRISSTGLQMVGAGQVGLNGAVDFLATLFLDPELSKILLAGVPQMQYVANSQGLIAVPVRLRGTVQNLSIEPDMDFIFQKVLLQKGQELMGKAFQKALTNTGETAQGTGEQGSSAYKNILSKLLR